MTIDEVLERKDINNAGKVILIHLMELDKVARSIGQRCIYTRAIDIAVATGTAESTVYQQLNRLDSVGLIDRHGKSAVGQQIKLSRGSA